MTIEELLSTVNTNSSILKKDKLDLLLKHNPYGHGKTIDEVSNEILLIHNKVKELRK